MDTVKCIRSMLRNTCRSVEKVPFDAHDYQSVVKLWVRYKKVDCCIDAKPAT